VTDESRHWLQIPGLLARVFLLVTPVVAVGVDAVAAEDVVSCFADHGDGGGGHQDQDWGGGVGAADAQVVQAAAVAQGEFAELVDGVVADADVVGGGVRWAGFGAGLVGLGWCGARREGADRPRWARHCRVTGPRRARRRRAVGAASRPR
jgi:hypothetical protein